jgi:hypothetical protein
VRRLTFPLGLCAIASCALDEGRPPLARIDITPPAILENDGFQTAVTLDGTASADPLDDPEGNDQLDFAWQILDDEFRFEGSRATSPAPTVRLRGDRPATIVLTVTDHDGLEATAVAHVQLTVR